MIFSRLMSMAAVTAWLLASAGFAFADADPAKLRAAKASAAAFIDMSKEAASTGTPARYGDPAVTPLLDKVFDTSDVEDGKPMTAKALQPIAERITIGVNVSMVYLLAGTGIRDFTKIGNDPAVIDRVTQNTVNFAREIGLFYDFELKLQSALIDAVKARVASAPPAQKDSEAFKDGIAQISNGSARTAAGVIQTIAQDGLTDEWRRERLPALLALAPKFATFLQPDEKTELRDLAQEAAGLMSDEQVKQGLESFAADLDAG